MLLILPKSQQPKAKSRSITNQKSEITNEKSLTAARLFQHRTCLSVVAIAVAVMHYAADFAAGRARAMNVHISRSLTQCLDYFGKVCARRDPLAVGADHIRRRNAAAHCA